MLSCSHYPSFGIVVGSNSTACRRPLKVGVVKFKQRILVSEEARSKHCAPGADAGPRIPDGR